MTLGTSGAEVVVAKPSSQSAPRVQGVNIARIVTRQGGLPVTGAACRIEAEDFDVTFVTPASVSVPVLHRPVAPAVLTCTLGAATGRRVLHADRMLETRDDLPDMRFGYVIGKVSAVLSEATNRWSHVRPGGEITLELN